MKVLLDINIMLDFLQRRAPFFEDAASLVDAVNYRQVQAALASHAITTLHYFLRKGAEPKQVEAALRWFTGTFEIIPSDNAAFTKAINLGIADYEDAVTCQCALDANCNYIVTRDRRGFHGSPVPAISPADILNLIQPR